MAAEDLSYNDMARIMSDVLKKSVRYQQAPLETYRGLMTSRGASPGMAQAIIDMMVAKNEGLDNAEPRTPESTTPTSFRQWCEEVLKPAVDVSLVS